MKNRTIVGLMVGLLIILVNGSSAQESNEEIVTAQNDRDMSVKHSLFGEIGGRTFFFGSFNYEFQLHKRISVGTGIGLINVQQGDIYRVFNSIEEKGRYLDVATTQMVFGNYFIGQNKHKLIITAGVTNFLFLNRNKYPSETVRSNESELEWNAGLGYQFSSKVMFYRLSGYVLSIPGSSDWFPKYIPWAGITIGWRL